MPLADFNLILVNSGGTMAENLTFKDIEDEAEYPIDLIKNNTQEEKKGDITSPMKIIGNIEHSTPTSHATNILKARTVANESQDNENSTQ